MWDVLSCTESPRDGEVSNELSPPQYRPTHLAKPEAKKSQTMDHAPRGTLMSRWGGLAWH